MIDPLSSFLRASGYNTFSRGGGDIRIFVTDIIRTALSGVAVLFLIMIIYGGYLWLTAAGNEEQVKKGTKIVGRAFVGLVITLGAVAITTLVLGITDAATDVDRGGAPSHDPVF